MRIALAQIRSMPGDVERNVERHLAALEPLAGQQIDLVVFPELSLTGYEPDIAVTLGLSLDDGRLDPLRRYADETGTVVAVGAPVTRSAEPVEKPFIGLIVFTPGRAVHGVGKRHLHPDEAAFFGPAANDASVLDVNDHRVGLAICFEISVAKHTKALGELGIAVYLASVAKSPPGVGRAQAALVSTASLLAVPALLVNCVGTCEGQPAGGGSMAVAPDGRVLARLGDSDEGLLVYDTDEKTATEIQAAHDE